jgi:hypothetical protein
LSPWERRERGGAYYTRSRREDGRVIREYVGGGALGAHAARKDALERQRREKQMARWRELQGELDAGEVPVNELSGFLDVLVRATLLAAGYHQHKRGEWRKRRE